MCLPPSGGWVWSLYRGKGRGTVWYPGGDDLSVTLTNFYEDDTMWHERLVLWPSMEDPHLWRSRFSKPTYRFSDAVDDDAFKKYVQKAIEEVKKAGHWDDSKIPQMMLNFKKKEVATTSCLGRMLVNRRLKGKGAIIDPSNQGLAPSKHCFRGFVWSSEENCEEAWVKSCQSFQWLVSWSMRNWHCQSGPGLGEGTFGVPGYVGSLQKRYEVPTPVLAELSKALGPETAALEVEGAEAGKSPDDARILAVEYDAQDKRHNKWKVVCQDLQGLAVGGASVHSPHAKADAKVLASDLGPLQANS